MRGMTRQPDEQSSATDAARQSERSTPRTETATVRAYLSSFTRRGRLDLERDRSEHRRFTALYDDLQN